VPLGLRLGTPVTKQLERPGSEFLFTGDALLPLFEPYSKAEVGTQDRERKMSRCTVSWISHAQYQRSYTLRGRGVYSAVARARTLCLCGSVSWQSATPVRTPLPLLRQMQITGIGRSRQRWRLHRTESPHPADCQWCSLGETTRDSTPTSLVACADVEPNPDGLLPRSSQDDMVADTFL